MCVRMEGVTPTDSPREAAIGAGLGGDPADAGTMGGGGTGGGTPRVVGVCAGSGDTAVGGVAADTEGVAANAGVLI